MYTTHELKNHLLFCNMNTYEARKATYERVQVVATLTDRNLWSSQGRMWQKEIYKGMSKSLPVATETGVVDSYNLIGCVTSIANNVRCYHKRSKVSAF